MIIHVTKTRPEQTNTICIFIKVQLPEITSSSEAGIASSFLNIMTVIGVDAVVGLVVVVTGTYIFF